MRPARFELWGMELRVKPEDDSADKGALLTTEAVEPSVTGSEIGVDKSRCLDGACGEYGHIYGQACFKRVLWLP